MSDKKGVAELDDRGGHDMSDAETIATLQALIAAERERCKKLNRIADEIVEQVKVTRAYAADSGMDRNQVELMNICTSHFLGYAAAIRAGTEGGE